MSDLREAAEMALKALENPWEAKPKGVADAIQALRQALAQPEQEQYVTKIVAMHEDGTYTTERIPLPKREWVGLTEERVEYLADKYAPPIHPAFTKDDDYWRFYQEIELELKENNT